MKRKIAGLLLGAAVLASGVAVLTGAPVAASAKPTITCTLSGNGTVTPGLSPKAAVQTLQVTTSLSGCTSSISGITSSSPNTTSTTSKKAESCTSLKKPQSSTTTVTINWNNSTTSTSTYKLTLKVGSATIKGKITAGQFKGDKFTGKATFAPGAGQDCFNTPITTVTISGTVTAS